MRRTISLVATVAAAVLLSASLASGRGTETVSVGDDFFAPAKLTVKQDTKVNFDWIGTNEHDVVKQDGPGKFFQSGPITGSGVQFKQTFKKAGKYQLICSLHEEMTMSVKVTERKKRK